MRTRTVIGVAVAAGTAAIAASVGGAALATAQNAPSAPAVVEVSPAAPANQWDCPEESGSAGDSADAPAAY